MDNDKKCPRCDGTGLQYGGDGACGGYKQCQRCFATEAKPSASAAPGKLYVFEFGAGEYYSKEDADAAIAAAREEGRQQVIEAAGLNGVTGALVTKLFTENDALRVRLAKAEARIAQLEQAREDREAQSARLAAPEGADVTNAILRDVAELDYSGNDFDEEKMMSVTTDDLRLIVARHLQPQAKAQEPTGEQPQQPPAGEDANHG